MILLENFTVMVSTESRPSISGSANRKSMVIVLNKCFRMVYVSLSGLSRNLGNAGCTA